MRAPCIAPTVPPRVPSCKAADYTRIAAATVAGAAGPAQLWQAVHAKRRRQLPEPDAVDGILQDLADLQRAQAGTVVSLVAIAWLPVELYRASLTRVCANTLALWLAPGAPLGKSPRPCRARRMHHAEVWPVRRCFCAAWRVPLQAPRVLGPGRQPAGPQPSRPDQRGQSLAPLHQGRSLTRACHAACAASPPCARQRLALAPIVRRCAVWLCSFPTPTKHAAYRLSTHSAFSVFLCTHACARWTTRPPHLHPAPAMVHGQRSTCNVQWGPDQVFAKTVSFQRCTNSSIYLLSYALLSP